MGRAHWGGILPHPLSLRPLLPPSSPSFFCPLLPLPYNPSHSFTFHLSLACHHRFIPVYLILSLIVLSPPSTTFVFTWTSPFSPPFFRPHSLLLGGFLYGFHRQFKGGGLSRPRIKKVIGQYQKLARISAKGFSDDAGGLRQWNRDIVGEGGRDKFFQSWSWLIKRNTIGVGGSR